MFNHLLDPLFPYPRPERLAEYLGGVGIGDREPALDEPGCFDGRLPMEGERMMDPGLDAALD